MSQYPQFFKFWFSRVWGGLRPGSPPWVCPSSETSRTSQPATRRHIPKVLNPQQYVFENLQSHIIAIFTCNLRADSRNKNWLPHSRHSWPHCTVIHTEHQGYLQPTWAYLQAISVHNGSYLLLTSPYLQHTKFCTLRDSRLPPRRRWDLPSSGTLRSVVL
jgi:hypothetical protein